MSIVTNELVWVEDALSARSLGSHPTQTLNRIAKYYHQHCGYSKKEIPDLLEKFLIRCDPDVSLVLWSDQIQRATKLSDSRPLIKIDGVSLSAGELSAVSGVSGTRQQRLLFTLICLAKYENAVRSNRSNWVRTEIKQIMALANIVTSSTVQMQLFADLHDAGMIAYAKRVDDLSVRVLCIDDDEQAMFVSDFRNLGNQYTLHRGGPFMLCEECGLVIRKKSNSQKYCPSCAGEMYTKHSIESVRRQRAASLYGRVMS